MLYFSYDSSIEPYIDDALQNYCQKTPLTIWIRHEIRECI